MADSEQNGSAPEVTLWGRIEILFESSKDYDNPIQEVALLVMFNSKW